MKPTPDAIFQFKNSRQIKLKIKLKREEHEPEKQETRLFFNYNISILCGRKRILVLSDRPSLQFPNKEQL